MYINNNKELMTLWGGIYMLFVQKVIQYRKKVFDDGQIVINTFDLSELH